jgi:hypothetical protein
VFRGGREGQADARERRVFCCRLPLEGAAMCQSCETKEGVLEEPLGHRLTEIVPS